MNKKALLLIIIVLAVVLVAGLVAVIAMSGANNNAPDVNADPPASDVAATDEPVQNVTDAPADSVQDETDAPVDPTQEEPTEPEDPVVTGPTLDMEDPENNGSSDVPNLPENTGKPAPEKTGVTYLDYHSMSADQQKAFINSFGSYDAFFEWHDAAKKAYEDSLIELDGTTPVDMEDIAGGN